MNSAASQERRKSAPFASVTLSLTCFQTRKSDLTEKLPLAETRGITGFLPAICRVGCMVLSLYIGAGHFAQIRPPYLQGSAICDWCLAAI